MPGGPRTPRATSTLQQLSPWRSSTCTSRSAVSLGNSATSQTAQPTSTSISRPTRSWPHSMWSGTRWTQASSAPSACQNTRWVPVQAQPAKGWQGGWPAGQITGLGALSTWKPAGWTRQCWKLEGDSPRATAVPGSEDITPKPEFFLLRIPASHLRFLLESRGAFATPQRGPRSDRKIQ